MNGSCSWMTTILPFMEQNALYESINWNSTFASRYSAMYSSANLYVFRERLVSAYVCPSNGKDPFYEDPFDGGTYYNQGNFMLMDYVGLSGAHPDPAGRPTKRFCHGYMSGGGAFVMNEWRGLQAITDGTSNTFIISELCGMLDVDKVKIYRTGNYFGGWLGMGGEFTTSMMPYQVTYSNSAEGPDVNRWANGIKTVRYPINFKAVTSASFDPTDGVNGIHGAYGINLPLSSPHTGGVNACLGDGSVRFVSETLDFTTLARLVTINDGLAASP